MRRLWGVLAAAGIMAAAVLGAAPAGAQPWPGPGWCYPPGVGAQGWLSGSCDYPAEATGQHWSCYWGLFFGQGCVWRWADNTVAPPPPW